jgi:hypothetical protein
MGRTRALTTLLAIKGIGQKRLDKMRKYLTVGKISPTKAASTKPATPPKPPPTKT